MDDNINLTTDEIATLKAAGHGWKLTSALMEMLEVGEPVPIPRARVIGQLESEVEYLERRLRKRQGERAARSGKGIDHEGRRTQRRHPAGQ
jgi:hypothetical protein